MKTHMNFATRDLQKSTAFYRALLQSDPVKLLDDYALFNPAAPASRGAHFGIAVDSTEGVERAIERLQSAGYETLVEREETCCYAKQTKVWAADPDGRRWEVYTVHEETEGRAECCSA